MCVVGRATGAGYVGGRVGSESVLRRVGACCGGMELWAQCTLLATKKGAISGVHLGHAQLPSEPQVTHWKEAGTVSEEGRQRLQQREVTIAASPGLGSSVQVAKLGTLPSLFPASQELHLEQLTPILEEQQAALDCTMARFAWAAGWCCPHSNSPRRQTLACHGCARSLAVRAGRRAGRRCGQPPGPRRAWGCAKPSPQGFCSADLVAHPPFDWQGRAACAGRAGTAPHTLVQ
jgi:hypothetical protein